MPRAILLICLLAVVACMAAGCAPMRTYPPVEGAQEFPWPGAEPIPTMSRRAIRHERLRTNDDGPYYVNLPPGTPPEVYEKLFDLLRDTEPMMQEDDPTYHIVQVRARGLQGEVDLVYSAPDVQPRFVTLTMRRDAMDWRVTNRRVWRINVDVPAPNYGREIEEPPPPPQAPEAPENPEDGQGDDADADADDSSDGDDGGNGDEDRDGGRGS